VNKDTLLTIAGIVAVGAMVFGLGLMFLGGTTKAGDTTRPSPAEQQVTNAAQVQKVDSYVMEALKADYDAAFDTGKYDDALQIASKGLNMLQPADSEWSLWKARAGDAAYLDEAVTMSNQRRYEEAKKHYDDVVQNPSSDNNLREWAQYRICHCWKNLNDWNQAVSAMRIYLDHYIPSPREFEVRLLYCEGLFSLDRGELGQKEVDWLLKSDAPEAIKTDAELKKAHWLSRVVLNNPIAPLREVDEQNGVIVPEEPAKRHDKKAEAVPLPEEALQAGPRSETGALLISPECLAKVKKHFAQLKVYEARQELKPYVGATSQLSKDDQARLETWWGNLMREMSRRKTGGNNS
jgi:tetratricopeptide (TPR) repeat protein